MENMRHMLSSLNSSKPLLLGFNNRIPSTNNTFANGGGYILAKEAVRRFVEIALVKMNRSTKQAVENATANPCVVGPEGPEDINLGS